MRNVYWLAGLLAASLFTQPARAQRPADDFFTDDRPGAGLAWQTRAQWAPPGLAATELVISTTYTEASGLTYTYPQQLRAGLPVYNQVVTLVFKDGLLRHHAGSFLPAKAFAGRPTQPGVPAATAVATALASLPGLRDASAPVALEAAAGPAARQLFAPGSVARRPIEARLVWAVVQGQPRLAWNVNVERTTTPDWLNIRVDAITGRVLEQDNWTVHEAAAQPTAGVRTQRRRASRPAATAARPVAPRAQPLLASPARVQAVTPATYRVVPYPGERPDVTAPRLVSSPWLNAGAGNAAATHGWHFDGTTNYTDTRGNNVWAYDDSLKQNKPGRFAAATSTGAALSFDYTPDFTKVPTLGKNRRAATVNLFYWNNLMHDIFYQYGFTEAAGNFQTDNLNRGGAGGDYVRAEAQDGSDTDNANFNTPPDGTGGRMQMFLWSPATTYAITVTAPSAVAGSYAAVESIVGTNNLLVNKGPVSGQLALYKSADSLACSSASTPLTGKVALLYRGICGPQVKARKAQDSGAIAVIIINNGPGAPVVIGNYYDNSVTIPTVMISQADGAALRAQLAKGVQVTLPKAPPRGPKLDSDFDDGVIAHEYGHGVSNRLTGGGTNTSCLYNAEQAGEGWSDYFALMMTTDWTAAQLTDGPKARGSATYAGGQAATGGGIRRYPYTTNLSLNPLTYANMADSTEVHAIGEIWCSALWDMTWNIIQQQGAIEPNLYNSAGTGGNAVALNLVMQGLKLQPCQPGFLDSRDAILAADSLLYGGQYHCAIWSAFARRGMGASAKEGASTSATDQTAAFDQPSVKLRKNTSPLAGNQFTVDITATCECQPAASLSISDQLPAGMQYVSSTGGTLGSGNTVTFSNLSFTKGHQRTFQLVARTAPGAGCPIGQPVNDDRETSTTGGLTPAVVTAGGGNAWVPTTARAHSGTTSWATSEPVVPSDVTLTSAAFTPTSFSVLSFYHFFNTELAADGGLVAISVNNGAWQNAASYFLQNGYNSTFDTGTAAAGQPCFSGTSSKLSGAAAFQQSLVDLSAFSGQSIRVRFQFQTDTGNGGLNAANTSGGTLGWFIDDIQVQNGCGGLQLVQLAGSAGTVLDSYRTPTFLLPLPPLYLTGVSPTDNTNAAPVGSNLVFNFNQPVTAASAGNVHVFSAQRGGQLVRPGGANVAGGGTATLTIDPAVDLRAGETVRVSVPATVQAVSGAFARTQVYQFTAGVSAASPGYFGNTLTQTGFSATARSLATADFNNDGHLDVLVAGRGGSNNLSLALGTGGGQLAAPTLLTAGSSLTAAVPADFNEDGNLDVAAVQNTSTGTVRLLLGRGDGTFAPAPTVAAGNGARRAATADLNADGHLDLLVTNQVDNSVSVLLGAGDGTFTPGPAVTGLPTAEDLAAGDVNGDGRVDFVASNFATTGLLYVRLGNGDGTFTAAADVAVASRPRGLALADFNGDGRLDVAALGFTTPNYLSVRLGDGMGTFAGGADLAAGSTPGSTVSAGDLDGDGDLDLFVTEGSGLARYFRNDGSGGFVAPPAVPVAGSLNSHALADMDEDGDLDLITVSDAGTNTAVATVVFNRPGLTLTASTPAANAAAASPTATAQLTFSQPLAAGSAAGWQLFSSQRGGRHSGTAAQGNTLTYQPLAGQPWLPGETVLSVATRAITSATDGAALVRPWVSQFTVASGGSGRGYFGAGPAVPTGTEPTGTALGDVDGDGDLDLLVANARDHTVRVSQNLGSGTFAAGQVVPVGHSPLGVVLADVDNDGDLDLLAAASSDSKVSVRLNTNGVFAATGQEVTTALAAYALAAADVDGDGNLDLLATCVGGNVVSVRLGNGDGTFATAGQDVPTGATPVGLALGDVDNDGDLDLLAAANGPGAVSVRLNDGTGTFAPTGQEVPVGTSPYFLALADLDGDGDLDLATANNGSGTASVRLNAAGQYATTGQEVPIGASPTGLALADVDADGRPDLLAVASDDQRVAVRLNAGGGAFTPTGPVLTVGKQAYYLALADLDNDGDLDLAVANQGDNNVTVAFNQTATPLPVQLVSFTAQLQGPAAVRLAWTTASELNSAHFELERSPGGLAFGLIGQVAAAGTSTTAHAYTFLDAALPAGASQLYYRLRQIDQDGTAHYSPVRVVALARADGLSLYPNPTAHQTLLSGATPDAAVQVLDATGRLVYSATADADGQARLALPASLARGLYLVRSGQRTSRLLLE